MPPLLHRSLTDSTRSLWPHCPRCLLWKQEARRAVPQLETALQRWQEKGVSRMGARTDSAVFFYLNTEMQEKNYFRLYNFSLKWAANAPKHTKWNIHNLFGISRPSLSVAWQDQQEAEPSYLISKDGCFHIYIHTIHRNCDFKKYKITLFRFSYNFYMSIYKALQKGQKNSVFAKLFLKAFLQRSPRATNTHLVSANQWVLPLSQLVTLSGHSQYGGTCDILPCDSAWVHEGVTSLILPAGDISRHWGFGACWSGGRRAGEGSQGEYKAPFALANSKIARFSV